MMISHMIRSGVWLGLVGVMGALCPMGLAQNCDRWDHGVEIGRLDSSQLPEASGLVASQAIPGRLYHVNDSGSGPYFFHSQLNGSELTKVQVTGVTPRDWESLAYGPCDDELCLYIGDIGDNKQQRPWIEITLIKEQMQFASQVTPLRKLRLVYPDKPRNAEGMTLTSDGDLLIITKGDPTYLYLLKQKDMESAGEPKTLTRVGQFPLGKILATKAGSSRIATGMDSQLTSNRLLVLTYTHAVEIDLNRVDLSELDRLPVDSIAAKVIELTKLPQQETIAYVADKSGSFIYGTEKVRNFPVTLFKVSCLNHS